LDVNDIDLVAHETIDGEENGSETVIVEGEEEKVEQDLE
jgi:hypothetical protein